MIGRNDIEEVGEKTENQKKKKKNKKNKKQLNFDGKLCFPVNIKISIKYKWFFEREWFLVPEDKKKNKKKPKWNGIYFTY